MTKTDKLRSTIMTRLDNGANMFQIASEVLKPLIVDLELDELDKLDLLSTVYELITITDKTAYQQGQNSYKDLIKQA